MHVFTGRIGGGSTDVFGGLVFSRKELQGRGSGFGQIERQSFKSSFLGTFVYDME